MKSTDPLQTRGELTTAFGTYSYYRLSALAAARGYDLARLPFSIRVLLENNLRHYDGMNVTEAELDALGRWAPQAESRPVIPFYPGRVLLQDFTGVPVVVDLAAMRSAVARLGGDPKKINPVLPVDLVIDHSLQVDSAGLPDSFKINLNKEYERNRERYEFLRWGQQAFENFRIVPPSTGIIHQVNLEYLAQVVLHKEADGTSLVYPDTLVGSDSHTTMVNSLGVLGWGVGGIEATAAMLGQPLDLVMPNIVGVRLSGKLREGVTPTDLTLTLTQLLRRQGVVNQFVEYFGPGLDSLSLADRAMIANMTPENGATLSFFPVDAQTLDYLRLSGRSAEQVALVEAYCQMQGLFRSAETPDPEFSVVLDLDLNSIEASLAGPRRPQDRLALNAISSNFKKLLTTSKTENGLGLEADRKAVIFIQGEQYTLHHGAVVIAAITSCTNTSNPYVMIAAGLLAKKAVAHGLRIPRYVKTSLTPGSRVVTSYLERAGLLAPLAKLGFTLSGYGCATCIGNSGPLDGNVSLAIQENKLAAAAVLSGNRNFEGRVHPQVQANYLASPALVVAYALAGTVDIDLTHDPLGIDRKGKPVMLRDLWPSSAEINAAIAAHVTPDLFQKNYADVFNGDAHWQQIATAASDLYPWQADSTYIQEPPFFDSLSSVSSAAPAADSLRMRALAVLGDSVTTDHISPAGDIPAKSAAGQYLQNLGVAPADFNSYGSRRGNFQVLARGTLANIRIKNKMLPGVEGSYALHLPDGEKMSLYEAAMRYKAEGTPLLLLAGKEYGTGSSRDWAAKGPLLLGIKAVLAESFERIHRSNLVGMGVLPLQFLDGASVASLNLNGHETYEISGLADLRVGQILTVRAYDGDCCMKEFPVRLCINTPAELAYFKEGGLLTAFAKSVLRQ
ncbi:MAG: aconitate hydratase AcnA [Anaerolineaceae bacterium]|nr:aconitate hydratase AcnA [Anaerolineaceae bacterium]